MVVVVVKMMVVVGGWWCLLFPSTTAFWALFSLRLLPSIGLGSPIQRPGSTMPDCESATMQECRSPKQPLRLQP